MGCPTLERLMMVMQGPSAWTMEMRSAMNQVRDPNPDPRLSPNPNPHPQTDPAGDHEAFNQRADVQLIRTRT